MQPSQEPVGAAGRMPRPRRGSDGDEERWALASYTVGVTADRRRRELVTLLKRRGARIMEAPALEIVPLHDDQRLLDATRAVLGASVDVVVATTGVGFRGWMAAAEGWGWVRRCATCWPARRS